MKPCVVSTEEKPRHVASSEIVATSCVYSVWAQSKRGSASRWNSKRDLMAQVIGWEAMGVEW